MKFDVQINHKDLYRYNMYYIFTSRHGIIALFFAAMILALAILTSGKIDTIYTVMYFICVVIILLYYPIVLYVKAKTTLRLSPVLSAPLHYEITEEGIKVSTDVQEDGAVAVQDAEAVQETEVAQDAEEAQDAAAQQTAILPWKAIYKVVTVKDTLYIFSSQVNAYILPREQIENVYGKLFESLRQNVEDYRLHLKWK